MNIKRDKYMKKVRVVPLAGDTPTGPPSDVKGDKYIMKKERVVPLTRDKPNGPHLHPNQIRKQSTEEE